MSICRATNPRYVRTRISQAVGLVLLALTAGPTACGPDEKPKKAGEGESCKTSKDCKSNLLCRQKVCVSKGDLDAGPNGDADAGMDNDADDGDPTEEEYFISYVLEPGRNAAGRLHVYNTGTDEDVTVSPNSIDCSANCWLSDDMKHFVYGKDAGGGALDIYVDDVGSNLKAKGNAEVLVKNVEDVSVDGKYVTYMKAGDSSGSAAYFKPIEGGKEKTVGTIDTPGGWFVAPEHDVGVTYAIGDSQQKMTMKVGKAAIRKSDGSYTFGGSNFQEQGGSYFRENVLTAASPDGELLALVTRKAPNDYQFCQRANKNEPWSSKQCDKSVAMKCGRKSRCTRLELTVQIVDVSNRDNLDQDCKYGDDDACGPIHECDAPSAKQSNRAKCIPKRVVLGVPQTKQGPNKGSSGCKLVEKDDSIDFTGVNGPISFGPDNDIYLVGERNRECIASQIVRSEDHAEDNQQSRMRVGTSSKIVRIDPMKGSYEIVAGLPDDKLFKAARCWNKKEQKLEIDGDCNFWVDRARVSPGGNEVAFTATNPNTGSWPKADEFVNLWHMLRDGSERWFTGDKKTDELHTTTEYLRVHPAKN